MKRLLRYLVIGTRNHGVTHGLKTAIGANKHSIYYDSDWTANTTASKSQCGVVIILNGGAVSWTSKQPEFVALSTTEVEYVALSNASQNVVHFRHLMHDLQRSHSGPTILYEDNDGAVKLANNPQISCTIDHIYTHRHPASLHMGSCGRQDDYCHLHPDDKDACWRPL
jgi:hypothetical protein